MEHQLGRINIVSWQDSHARDTRRPGGLSSLLAFIALGSAMLLVLRFVFGAPLPLPLLQLAFGMLVAAGALLLMRLVVSLILRLQRN